MSNLLEQAIIDATALKEAAYKSAIASLEDKYSQELKESVEKILEQEELEQDPTEPPKMEIPGGGEQEKASEKAFDNVPSSFLDGPDDELITITFDEIKKEIKQAIGGEEPELGAEQGLEIQNAMNPDGTLAIPPEQAAAAASAPPVAPAMQAPMQESIELDEDLLVEMAEDEEIELDENILLEMSSCGYEEDQDELEETLGSDSGELDAAGDDGESLEETEAGVASGLSTQNAAAEEAKRKEEIATATKNAKTANTTANNLADQAKMARQNADTANRDLAALKNKPSGPAELEEETVVDMDYNPFHDTSGYLRTSQQDQTRQFKAALAKIKVKLKEELNKFVNENKKLTKQINKKEEEFKLVSTRLSEYYSAYNQLVEQVENLNISNAKLLYTNKVLGNNSLNERQKQSIVESLSRTNSVDEAKAIYEALQSTVQTVSEKRQKESLSEALNRGPSPFIVRKNHQGDDNLTERMKILAGIKK